MARVSHRWQFGHPSTSDFDQGKSIDLTVLAGARDSSLGVFQVHCIDAEGKVLIPGKLKRYGSS